MAIRAEFLAALDAAKAEAQKPEPSLHRAARVGKLEDFQTEYEKTNIHDETDADRKTIMHHACNHEGCEILMFLLNHEHSLIHKKDIMGQTPLHIATREGNKLAIELLKAAGARENEEDLLGRTPKEYASIEESSPQQSSKFSPLRKSMRRVSAPPSAPPQPSTTFRILHQSFPRQQGSMTPDLANPQNDQFRSLDSSPKPQRSRSLSNKVSQAVTGITDRFKEPTDLP